jgi:adenosine/AMP kinase
MIVLRPAEYPILELSDNKKELNTKITRALIGIVDDVNTLSCETTEEIKEQLELLDIAAKVTNNIKTYY